eukprot:4513772-Karenia_brevis.AAC.1
MAGSGREPVGRWAVAHYPRLLGPQSVRAVRDDHDHDQEVKEHYETGQSVFRSWCGVCVRARSKEWACKRDVGKERVLPEYVWDYCFPGDAMGFKWTVLVGKERRTGMIMATT